MIYEPESEWLIKNEGFHFTDNADGRVYVDLGCGHPSICSQTAFVRAKGWQGLAVDANPDYAKDWIDAGFGDHFYHGLLATGRRARFAIHDNSQTSRISPSPETDHPEKWGINRVVEMETTPIAALLDLKRIGFIHLLSLDLEGLEFEILHAIDLKKHTPMYIICEYVAAESEPDLRVMNYLIANGYEAIYMNSSNIIYRRK